MASSVTIVEQILSELRAKLPDQANYWLADRDALVEAAQNQLKDAPPETVVEFVLSALRLMRGDQNPFTHALNPVVGMVLRRKLPVSEDVAVEMLELIAVPYREFPFKGVLKAAESIAMTPRLAERLRALRPCITEFLGGTEMREIHARIDAMLNGPPPRTLLTVQGAWSKIVFHEIAASPKRSAWEHIFFHTAELKSTEASRKWRLAAREHVDAMGAGEFLDAAMRWLRLGPSPDRPGIQLTAEEADLQKGFVWFLADQHAEGLAALIADFAAGALKKITMIGAVSQKVGNACVNVLAELPGADSVAQLSRLARQVRYDTAQRLIGTALNRAAEKAGVSRDELEEMSVPDYGLDPDGSGTEQAAPKEIEKMLSAHRARIERLLLSQRAIAVEKLRSCYLDHPLISKIARSLIWQFESGLGIWRDGRIVDDTGQPIDLTKEEAPRLWHPVSSGVETILHWRCWLEDNGIRQPFKQAHREVYLLTDAERETGLFSNRFAAHILRQHPFAALCEQRGWKYRLMGQWDSHNTPMLVLPDLGMTIEYDVDFPTTEDAVSGHFIYMLIRTGSVRFLDAARKPLELTSIPPKVFSEVMRDVDLFTGVTSIGSDPAWGRRPAMPFQNYWEAFSFGDLSQMAQERAGLLARLLPRLAIRDRCSLDGKFLVVRGRKATYRIHVGSGNVLMEPGSRYLCIVEGGATKALPRNIALPFDEDHKLSQILSKAFLLADDHKIKDQSILRQLPLTTN